MIQRSIRALRKIAAVAALVVGAAGFGLGGVQAAEPIKVGTFLAVTGPASFLGDPELKTLEMYVEQVNAAGGVLGRPLELISYDAQHDAKKAVTFVKRLLEQPLLEAWKVSHHALETGIGKTAQLHLRCSLREIGRLSAERVPNAVRWQ